MGAFGVAEQCKRLAKSLPKARLNRSRSKGYYRRTTKGISWFKDTATEPVRIASSCR